MRISDWSSDVCSSDLPYAARGACGQFDGAFFGQGLQMVFGGIGRFKTQGACDFGPCRWETGTSDFAAYEFKNLLLTLGKLDGHGNPDCVFIQSGFCNTLGERSSLKPILWQ